jgi:sugar phosphate isomerase/epimerase
LKAETQARDRTLKGRLPFRLGTTSYILPDDLVPNVTFLADRVDDVELVLFESHEVSNLPDEATIETLATLAAAHDLTYTVHLPLDADLGHPNVSVRQRSVAKCRKVIRLTQALHPFAYVLHLTGDRQFDRVPATDIAAWQRALDDSIVRLLDDGPAPDAFCIETLAYPYEHVWDLVQRHDLAVCLDVGHILLYEHDLASYLEAYLSRCRVVHLHGIRGGRDHCDIADLPNTVVDELIGKLRATANGRERVVTLEVFSLDHLQRSLDRLGELL